MNDIRSMSRTYTNRSYTASGSDELIVELMKSLIGITDQNVIRKVTIQVEYQKPHTKESDHGVTAQN